MKFKFIDTATGKSFDDFDDSSKEELEESVSLTEKVFNKFYKYTGIEPGSEITKDDIRNYRLTAFERIGFEEGLTNEGVEKILLRK